ncbi:MAG: N-acetyltransferase [Candidatus Kerfeldbacteria bacterium]|nr:N-acetyltransferase [Candidatus Kerfeldbacteria bacterium]
MPTDYFAHESSYIDEGAKIGTETKIWHFCHIMSGAIIGAHCSLGQNVNVAGGAVVGNHVKIQNNVSIYDGVTVEDYVFCGPSMVFTNDPTPRAKFPLGRTNYKKTILKEGSSIGANATIVCGNTIGKSAFIGSGSVVTKDIPDYAIAYGNPARVHGWICECGSKLVFADEKAICARCSSNYLKKDDHVTKQ